MKQQLLAFIDNLVLFDYILFAGVTLLFMLMLIFAVALRNRFGLALFMIMAAFAELVAGYTLGYSELHAYLYKNDVKVEEFKQLAYTDALVVKGSVTNVSERPFRRCRVDLNVHKVSDNPLLGMIYPLKPLAERSVLLETPLQPGSVQSFKTIIEPFTYAKEYNLTIGVLCN